MLISVGCFAAVNLMVKFLPHLPATELVLFRSLITFVISYFASWQESQSLGQQ